MPIVLARIDQRFIHGQILVSSALARCRVSAVVVCDRKLCGDAVRKRIFDGALTAADPPLAGGAHYAAPEDLAGLLRTLPESRFLALFGDIAGALAATSSGVRLESLNLGNFCSLADVQTELHQGFRAGPEELDELDELSRRVPRLWFGPLDGPCEPYRPRKRARG
jgi:mannose/fructose/N-acetylgalactosamine-specific phosphotransferase system component IIB